MTTATLRPDGTLTAATSVVGAATTHAALSDNSDASYIVHTLVAGVAANVSLGTVALPAGAITKQLRARVRARCLVTGFGDEIELEVATTTGTVAESKNYVGIATFADYATAYAVTGLTQAQVDAVSVSVGETGRFGGGLQIAEAYADLVYVVRPVVAVTAVTPDPYTPSNVVPIAWTNTLDADGGGQTRRRVKVFTAAQYGIGGFDPETSPFTWDSGDVLTSLLTESTSPLATGVTYRAYVKVAQTVNGVSHWSVWAFDQFQVTVTTSDILSVTVAPVNASARIDVTVNRNTGTAAWNFVEVQRSTDAGVTWSDVRSATYVDSTGSANTFTVSDWETGNGQAVLYRARATRLISALPITGPWVSSGSTSWTSALAWLKSPLNPTKNLAVVIEAPFGAQQRTIRAGEFTVIGRPAPVVISDVVSLPGSVVLVRTDLAADIPKLIALLSDTNLLLQQIPESRAGQTQTGSQYVTIRSAVEEQRVGFYTDMRLWTLGYLEVDAPADPTAGR